MGGRSVEMTAPDTLRDESLSGWYAVLPEPPPPRRLEDHITADWVVIGAGFAGIAAARRLSELRPDDRIVLLESQRLGWGANGRNSGFMIDLPHELNSESYGSGREQDLRQIRHNRAGIAYARSFAEAAGLSDVIRPLGKYHGAADSAGANALNAFCAHLDALEEPYSRLDAAAMKAVTGSEHYVAGIHTPGACLMQPAAYIRGLASRMPSNVTVLEESPVIGLSPGPSPRVRTPQGSVAAGAAIVTVNGAIAQFGLYRRQLLHVFTYASMTRLLSDEEQVALGGQPEWGLIPADPMGTTVRRTADHRLVIRNTFTYNPSMKTSAAQIERIGPVHDRSFRARFPQIKHVEMAYRWGGRLCLSLNSVPVFGEIRPAVYAACCQNGLGTVKGTLLGKLAADLVAGGDDPMTAEFLAMDPPAKLYPEPMMTLGARGKLWWMHKRAGADL